MLAGQVHDRVVDQTGLSGVFEINLDWDAGVPAESNDNLLSAVESQLGLKVERRRTPLDVVIVDHADRTPVEN